MIAWCIPIRRKARLRLNLVWNSPAGTIRLRYWHQDQSAWQNGKCVGLPMAAAWRTLVADGLAGLTKPIIPPADKEFRHKKF